MSRLPFPKQLVCGYVKIFGEDRHLIVRNEAAALFDPQDGQVAALHAQKLELSCQGSLRKPLGSAELFHFRAYDVFGCTIPVDFHIQPSLLKMKYRKPRERSRRDWGILGGKKDMAKEILTMNDVWLKIAQFLGALNGENVKRESYVRTPEYEAALEAWKETEQEWEAFLESLPADGQEKAEEMKERLEDFSSAQEKRAYIQGYADCIQALYHMGLLKENEGLKWAEKMDVH